MAGWLGITQHQAQPLLNNPPRDKGEQGIRRLTGGFRPGVDSQLRQPNSQQPPKSLDRGVGYSRLGAGGDSKQSDNIRKFRIYSQRRRHTWRGTTGYDDLDERNGVRRWRPSFVIDKETNKDIQTHHTNTFRPSDKPRHDEETSKTIDSDDQGNDRLKYIPKKVFTRKKSPNFNNTRESTIIPQERTPQNKFQEKTKSITNSNVEELDKTSHKIGERKRIIQSDGNGPLIKSSSIEQRPVRRKEIILKSNPTRTTTLPLHERVDTTTIFNDKVSRTTNDFEGGIKKKQPSGGELVAQAIPSLVEQRANRRKGTTFKPVNLARTPNKINTTPTLNDNSFETDHRFDAGEANGPSELAKPLFSELGQNIRKDATIKVPIPTRSAPTSNENHGADGINIDQSAGSDSFVRGKPIFIESEQKKRKGPNFKIPNPNKNAFHGVPTESRSKDDGEKRVQHVPDDVVSRILLDRTFFREDNHRFRPRIVENLQVVAQDQPQPVEFQHVQVLDEDPPTALQQSEETDSGTVGRQTIRPSHNQRFRSGKHPYRYRGGTNNNDELKEPVSILPESEHPQRRLNFKPNRTSRIEFNNRVASKNFLQTSDNDTEDSSSDYYANEESTNVYLEVNPQLLAPNSHESVTNSKSSDSIRKNFRRGRTKDKSSDYKREQLYKQNAEKVSGDRIKIYEIGGGKDWTQVNTNIDLNPSAPVNERTPPEKEKGQKRYYNSKETSRKSDVSDTNKKSPSRFGKTNSKSNAPIRQIKNETNEKDTSKAKSRFGKSNYHSNTPKSFGDNGSESIKPKTYNDGDSKSPSRFSKNSSPNPPKYTSIFDAYLDTIKGTYDPKFRFVITKSDSKDSNENSTKRIFIHYASSSSDNHAYLGEPNNSKPVVMMPTTNIKSTSVLPPELNDGANSERSIPTSIDSTQTEKTVNFESTITISTESSFKSSSSSEIGGVQGNAVDNASKNPSHSRPSKTGSDRKKKRKNSRRGKNSKKDDKNKEDYVELTDEELSAWAEFQADNRMYEIFRYCSTF